MDKVRPENQSEHTPVSPVGNVASPNAAPRPRTCAATAGGEFSKRTTAGHRIMRDELELRAQHFADLIEAHAQRIFK